MKRVYILIVAMLFLSGCAYNMEYPVAPTSFHQQTKESIYAQSKVGKTTNIEVLKFLQYPTSRYIFDSGLLGYNYDFRVTVPLEKKSTGLTTEVQYMLSTGKSCLFIFNKNGVLRNIVYNENSLGYQTKYDLIKAPDNLDDTKFIETFLKLKNGTSTGAIFRQIGKPEMVHEHGGTEFWQYRRYDSEDSLKNLGLFSIFHDKKDIERMQKRAEIEMRHYAPAHTHNIPGYASILYLLEVKNNRLVNKHIMKADPNFTEEETKVLPPIEYKKFQKTGTEKTESNTHG